MVLNASHLNANAINRGKKRYHRLRRLGSAKWEQAKGEGEKEMSKKKGIDKYIRGKHINNKYKEIYVYTFFWWCVDGDGQVYEERKDLEQFQLGTQAQWSKRASVFAHSL